MPPFGAAYLDYPILFKVTQKTTPATFIEWRNMFDIKMTWLISPNSDKYKQIPLNIKNTNRQKILLKHVNSLSLSNKKPPKSGGYLLPVWFAASPAD